MVDDDLKYDVMVERALRGVLREALIYVAENGLPGEHHFYITFRTDHPDVDIPDHLHERYPSEMTIVLQHQYWSLEVSEENFGITLSFSDIPERLTVPFDSVVAFADPSVRFGLQFDGGAAAEDTAGEDRPSAEIETLPVGAAKTEPSADKTAATPARKAPAKPKKSTRKSTKKSATHKAADKAADTDGEDDDPEKVITLDSFRKK